MPTDSITPKKYLDLSNESYRNESLFRDTDTEGDWVVIDQTQNPETGYAAIAYQGPNGEIVITHRGSDPMTEILDKNSIGNSRKDWLESNRAILEGRVPPQFNDADEFTKNIYNQFGETVEISHTGHSLGGALAQLTAHKYDSNAVTFDNPGIQEVIVNNKDVFSNETINHENFNSYLSLNSVVSSINTQIGNPTKLDIDKLLGIESSSNKDNLTGELSRGYNSFKLKNLFDRHDLNNISEVFGEDGQPLEDFIMDMSTIQESDINQFFDYMSKVSNSFSDKSDNIVNEDSENSQIIENILKQKTKKEDLDAILNPQTNEGIEFPDRLPDTGAAGIEDISDASVVGLVQELRSNVDLLFSNMSNFKNSIGGI